MSVDKRSHLSTRIIEVNEVTLGTSTFRETTLYRYNEEYPFIPERKIGGKFLTFSYDRVYILPLWSKNSSLKVENIQLFLTTESFTFINGLFLSKKKITPSPTLHEHRTIKIYFFFFRLGPLSYITLTKSKVKKKSKVIST